MPIDRAFIGYEAPPMTVDVERGRLRFFAQAIGETSPVFSDLAAACAAGYRDLPAPPTFAYTLEMEGSRPFALLERLGVAIERVLHGEQRFAYHVPIVAGDTLTVRASIDDIYTRPPSPYEFIAVCSEVRNAAGEPVVTLFKTLVVRPESAAS
ncbi:dehydratase [Vulcanimicrobium alpinum]|uniref:Dehydratase n=1 Tax=Vulcanimicrobium alpinum TaxID=3016050 RepID=A0AAN1XY21_UNVUL|nr:MaoC family dehydratase N-terminal domain-containing protein [Vulcanimicrobium alpinum]BDE07459.1 dehydratase [Vulcanimicrobium alpinum]